MMNIWNGLASWRFSKTSLRTAMVAVMVLLSFQAEATLTDMQRDYVHRVFQERGYKIGSELEIPDGPLSNLTGLMDFRTYQLRHPDLVAGIPVEMVRRYLDDTRNLVTLPLGMRKQLTDGLLYLRFSFEKPNEMRPRHKAGPALPAGTILDSNGTPLRSSAASDMPIELELSSNVKARMEWEEVQRRWNSMFSLNQRREAVDINRLSARDKIRLVMLKAVDLRYLSFKDDVVASRRLSRSFENIEYDYDLIFPDNGAEIAEFRNRKPYNDEHKYFADLQSFGATMDVWDWMQHPRSVASHESLEARAPAYQFHLSRDQDFAEDDLKLLNLFRLAQGWSRHVNYLEDPRISRVSFQNINQKGLIRRINNRHIEVRNQLESPEEELFLIVSLSENKDQLYSRLAALLPSVFTAQRLREIITGYVARVKETKYTLGGKEYAMDDRTFFKSLNGLHEMLDALWAAKDRTGFDPTAVMAQALAKLAGLPEEMATRPVDVVAHILANKNYWHKAQLAFSFEGAEWLSLKDADSVFLGALSLAVLNPDPEFIPLLFTIAGDEELTKLYEEWSGAKSKSDRYRPLKDFCESHPYLFSSTRALNYIMASRNPKVIQFFTELWLTMPLYRHGRSMGFEEDRSRGQGLFYATLHQYGHCYDAFHSNDLLLEHMAGRLKSENGHYRDALQGFLLSAHTRNQAVSEAMQPLAVTDEFFDAPAGAPRRLAAWSPNPWFTQRLMQIISSSAHPTWASLFIEKLSVAAQSGGTTVQNFLVNLLENPDAWIRSRAFRTLAFLYRRSSKITVLLDHFEKELDPYQRRSLLEALMAMRPTLTTEQQLKLVSLTQDDDLGLFAHIDSIVVLKAVYRRKLTESARRSFQSKLGLILSEIRNYSPGYDGEDEVSSEVPKLNRTVRHLFKSKTISLMEKESFIKIMDAFRAQTILDVLEDMYPQEFERDPVTHELRSKRMEGKALESFLGYVIERLINNALFRSKHEARNCQEFLDMVPAPPSASNR